MPVSLRAEGSRLDATQPSVSRGEWPPAPASSHLIAPIVPGDGFDESPFAADIGSWTFRTTRTGARCRAEKPRRPE